MHERHQTSGRPMDAEGTLPNERMTANSSAAPACESGGEGDPSTLSGENGFCPEESGELDWEKLLMWGVVALSFAAFLLCGCILWAKCGGDWPN